ncbi:immunoglobulin-like domain-containing protein, partial [Hyalangium sp.]|uniref:immunoglobulin-like domain-containing protein n=1 Tax=Hyalangium sp. TaxID=2028555 RepID=UPI002D3E3DCB
TRTVTVDDDAPPTLTLLGQATQRLECATPFNDPGATANDACFGDLTGSITRNGTVNTGAPNDYPLVYNVTDGAGNSAPSVSRTVEVRDTQQPSITVLGPLSDSYECGSGEYLDPGATAADSCAGNLTSAIVATPTQDPNVPARFTLTYRVVDPSGNTAVSPVTRTVTMNDSSPPTIVLNDPDPMTLECPAPFNDPGATASDLCLGDVSSSITRTGTVDTGVPASYELTYDVADSAGNRALPVSRRVNVVDHRPPVIACPDPLVVTIEEGEQGSTVTLAEAAAEDECDPTVRIDSPPETLFLVGTTTVTYTATDDAGNTATCTSTVTVKVTAALPDTLIVSHPPEETEDTGATFEFRATKPNVTYECSLDGSDFSECSVTTTLNALAEGEHTLRVRARDSSGNVDPTPAFATWMVVPPPVAELDRALLGGAGCSSTGDSPSSLAMVGLGVLAVLWARKRTDAGLSALVVLLVGARAFAQPQGVPTFELELLRLNPSGTGSLLLGTGELPSAGDYRFSLTTHYENDPLVLFQNGTEVGVVVRHRATAHLAASYGLWGWLELGAQVPVLLLQRGDDLTGQGIGKPEGGLSPGTPLLTLRLKLLAQREEDPVDLSLGVHAGPTVGSGAALAREPRAIPSLMVGRRFSRLRAALDAGILLRPRTILSDDGNIQDELGHALRLGGTLATLGERLRGELAVLVSVPLRREGSAIETLTGARWPVSDSLEAYGLAGLGFGSAPGTPDFRLLLGVAYGRTRPVPAEVARPEPTPEPKDTDGDGLVDGVDQCPSVVGLPELQGCPDQDGDGLADEVDRCPSEPGPAERQGCPAKDSDGDAILDEVDACPMEPGIPEMHGCPARDTDKDTVQDHLDNCPEVVGPPGNQGCPVEEKQLVAIQKDRIQIKDTVHFDFDKAVIQARSFPLLDQVARILLEHPEILSVTIEGHTDDQGSAEYNRSLSQRRAEAVRDYLAQKTVAPERMEARGFGEDRPVQSNATEEGRAANRRVEFITRYTQAGP